MQNTRFILRNDDDKCLTLNVEPESHFVEMAQGEEVVVSDTFDKSPSTLRFSRTDSGEAMLTFWPGDGEVRVLKDGVDLLDLIATTAAV